MNQIQAENKARDYNRMTKGKPITYMAHPMERTKWEKDRWGVVELLGDNYPQNVVGIAAS